MLVLSSLAVRVGFLLSFLLMVVRVASLIVDFGPVPTFRFNTTKEGCFAAVKSLLRVRSFIWS